MQLGIRTQLAAASAALGAVLGLLEIYSLQLQLPLADQAPFAPYSIQYLVVAWASLAVTYPVTVLLFYFLGKRLSSGFVTGGDLIAIYGGALLGMLVGLNVLWFFLKNWTAFALSLSYAYAPSASLSFLFIAFSGFALSNLTRTDGGSGGPTRGILVPLVAAAFGLFLSFYTGTLALSSELVLNLGFATIFGLLPLVAVVVSFPLELAVFYYLGRRFPISGRTFRYFGLLFVGLYLGTIVGSVAAVALFGQNAWTILPGQGTYTVREGIPYQDVALSLQLLLQSLNPIGSLPFFPFFAMSLSRTARPSTMSSGMAPESSPGSEVQAPSGT